MLSSVDLCALFVQVRDVIHHRTDRDSTSGVQGISRASRTSSKSISNIREKQPQEKNIEKQSSCEVEMAKCLQTKAKTEREKEREREREVVLIARAVHVCGLVYDGLRWRSSAWPCLQDTYDHSCNQMQPTKHFSYHWYQELLFVHRS